MKINPKINTRVNESVAECRKVLVSSTIELLRQICKSESYEVVVFSRILFLYQTKNNVSETILADRIEYNWEANPDYFFVNMNGDSMGQSSANLSLSNLQVIFEEVRNLVRNY